MPYLYVEHQECKLPEQTGKRADHRVKAGTLAKCGFPGCDRMWRLKEGHSYYDCWEEVEWHRGNLVVVEHEPEPEPEWRPRNEHYGDGRPRPPRAPEFTTGYQGGSYGQRR